jgi:hypothetical protein
MRGLEKFVETAVDQVARDLSAVMSIVRIPVNHIEAILRDAELTSQMHLNRSIDRAEIYERFQTLKSYYKMVSEPDGSYVYYFLCSVELLPVDVRDAAIFQTTAFLTSNPDAAKKAIAQSVQDLCEAGLASRPRSLLG